MATLPEQPTDAVQAAAPPIPTPAPPAPQAVASPAPARTPRRLHPAVWRLILMAALFLGWMGYLAYLVGPRLVTGAAPPPVVSRAQVLMSEVDVVARVDAVDESVTVEQTLWSADPRFEIPAGTHLHVTNLKECRSSTRSEEGGPLDFTGPGSYLLLLQRSPEGEVYRVAPVPPSPGYKQYRPRIYPATPEVLAQYRASAKPLPAERPASPRPAVERSAPEP